MTYNKSIELGTADVLTPLYSYPNNSQLNGPNGPPLARRAPFALVRALAETRWPGRDDHGCCSHHLG